MTDLASCRVQVLAILKDATQIAWTTGEVDAALRTALKEYSLINPQMIETVIDLPGNGRMIALDSIDNLIGVAEVWWPFDSDAASETWPPNRVAGWRLIWDNAQPVLFLTSKDGSEPQKDDEVRIWYFTIHSIQDLDGGDITSLPLLHHYLVCQGAAGYAADTGALNRSEVLDPELVRKWASSQLAEYRREIERIRGSSVRTEGEPYGPGWKLDKYDL